MTTASMIGTSLPAAANPFDLLGRHGDGDPLPAETIAARQKFFGRLNVDRRTGEVRANRVVLSWIGVSTFAAAFDGHVVLLDGWIPRGSACFPTNPPTCPPIWNHSMAYVGSTPDELAALKPEVFFIGHAHFDHAGDLPTVIEANPEMSVVGTEEHCSDIALVSPSANCMAIFAAGAPLGATADLSDVVAGVDITAVKQPHSTPMVNPADPPFGWPSPCAPIAAFPPDPADPLSWQGLTGGFVAVAYQFRIGELAIMWQDTAGPIAGTPVVTAFGNLPPTDVRLGSVVVAGRSVLNQHLEALEPDLFVPLHGDPCFANVNEMVRRHINETVPPRERPQVRYLTDPDDFLDPMTLFPWSPRWRD